MRPVIRTLLAALACTSASASSDWPQWRGPNFDGTSSDAKPPTEWSATKNIRWKTAIPGKGSSTPAVLGDRVFVTSAIADGDQQEFMVFCLDRDSGDMVWKQSVNKLVPHAGHHEDHGYASASPITDGKHVWAHFGSRGLFCLTADKGALVWKRTDLGKMVTRGGFGDGSTPLLAEGKIIVPWDHEGPSYIAALDAKTGDTVWKTDRDHPTAWVTPLVVKHEGRQQVIQSGQGFAVAYDLEDGKEIWRADGQTQRPVATPVAAGGVVYIGSGFRGAFLAAYQLDGAKGDITDSAKQLWSVDKATPDIASFLLSGGRLYFHSGKDGILSCHDAKTGKAHYSRERIDGVRRVYASPVAANGHVYLTGRDGTIAVIKDSAKLEIVATNELGEPVDATPVPAGDALFIRGARHLYCVGE